jgi:hypothetical protein
MAGYLVGSAIMTWVLCSALNALVESVALRRWVERNRAFISLLVGILVIAGLMLWVSLAIFPVSSLASLHMTAPHVRAAAMASAAANVLLALAYGGVQLRRFWDDE